MKNFLFAAGLGLTLLVAACTQELEQRVGVLEGKLASLQTQVEELNSQVGLLQQLLSGKYYVQSVSDLSDGSGYKLVLVDANGNTVEKNVYNGQKGDSPVLSVRKDNDGNYYWTINGEWMLVDGKKVRANGTDGKDGLTPEVKVEDGKWYYRLDGGQWIYAGDAVTTVQGPILSVDYTTQDGIVIFVLADGSTLEVPFASAGNIKLQIVVDATAFQTLGAGKTGTTPYEVRVPAGVTYTLDSYEPQGWTVTYSAPKANKGTLTIKRPSGSSAAKVLLIAEGSDGSSFVKVLHVGSTDSGTTPDPADDTVYMSETVDATSGSVSLPAGATSVVIPASAQSWVSLQGNKLVLSENTSYDARTAVITFKVGDKTYSMTITQAQKDAIVLTASSVSAPADGGSVACVVKANVTVKATSGASWISVSPNTKGLVEKVFTLTATANTTGVARSGQVTFSSGSLSQVVTVNQDAQGSVTPPNPPVSGDDEFVLVTDASQLEAGDEILILNEADSQAIGTNQKTNNRAAASVTISDHTVVAEGLSSSVQVITLEGSAGSWNLSVGDNSYLSSDASGNKLLTKSTVNNNSTWTISIDAGGEATVVAKAGASQYLRYNPNSNNSGGALFSCYTSTSSIQNPVYIYRKGAGSSEPSYVTQYTQPGLYLGSQQRIYTAGTDQYLRQYSGNTLSFILLDPDAKEQLVISGINTAAQVGQTLSVSVAWTKAGKSQLSKQYSWDLLQDTAGQLWIGDNKGKGIIVKK